MSRTTSSTSITGRVKSYLILRKVENNFRLIIVNIIMTILLLVGCYYIYFINSIYEIKASATAMIVILSIYYIGRIATFTKVVEEDPSITKLALINKTSGDSKEWYIDGKTSILIGKRIKNSKVDVDIDLSNLENSLFINNVHAVMNFAANSWFIEDLGSANGVGIKRKNESFKKRLKVSTPYKLEQGDIIYIANIKIMVK